jgi:outer membrane protein assembly factor BamB
MKRGILLIIFLLMISSTNAQLAESPSPMFKGNVKHTGLSQEIVKIDNPQMLWRFNATVGVETTPAIGADGTIYFGTYKNYFFALYPNGTEKWNITRLDDGFSSSPAIGRDGTIYLCSHHDNRPVYNQLHDEYMAYGVPSLYAYYPNGTMKWEFVTGGIYAGTISPPTIGPDGVVYVGSGGSKMQTDVNTGDMVWAIYPNGTAKWKFNTGDAVFTSPAIGDDGTIYVAAANYSFFAIDSDGNEIWEIKSEGYFDSSPTIGADGTIYVGSTDKLLYAVTPEGQVKWTFEVDDILEASPSIGPDGTIYVGVIDLSEDKHLYALYPNGTEKWRFVTGGGVYATPVISADGILYFGSYDGNLYSLYPNGTEKWRFVSFGGIVSPPAIANGVVYFGSWDKHLYAIGESDGVNAGRKGTKNGKKSTFRNIIDWFKSFFEEDATVSKLSCEESGDKIFSKKCPKGSVKIGKINDPVEVKDPVCCSV